MTSEESLLIEKVWCWITKQYVGIVGLLSESGLNGLQNYKPIKCQFHEKWKCQKYHEKECLETLTLQGNWRKKRLQK